MVRKRNDILVEDVTGTSQYDGQQVLKDAHSLPGHYIRTKESLTLVSPYFDSFQVTYDGENPVEVEYYAGTSAHLTTIGFIADSGGSLAGSYFIISSGRKDTRYAVYYTVDAAGSAPNLPGTINVEVPISTGDSAEIVAFATEMVLKSLQDPFRVDRKGVVLEISTKKLGMTNNTLEVGTGFTISNVAGTNQLVETVNLSYSSSGNPIWQSEELVDYKYNVYTGRFELFPDVQVELETTATSFVIYNVEAPDANTAVTINIPDSTKRFSLQASVSSSKVSIIDQVSGDKYTVRYGSSIEFDTLDTLGLSFDVETTKDDNTIEMILWS